jgi:hypothetical protein
MLSRGFPINTFLKQQEQSRELKAWWKSCRSQQYIMGFIAELPIAIVIPKFLIISLKFAEMSKYFRGPVSINGVQKMKKRN